MNVWISNNKAGRIFVCQQWTVSRIGARTKHGCMDFQWTVLRIGAKREPNMNFLMSTMDRFTDKSEARTKHGCMDFQ